MIIAFFDFDGTITRKDSLFEFIKFGKGRFYFYLGFALNLPWLLAYKIKWISNQAAKERVLTFFFGGMTAAGFQALCDRFAATRVPGLIRPKAWAEIERLRVLGARIVIVSASPENWLQAFARDAGADLIATQLETMPPAATTSTSNLRSSNPEVASPPLRLTGKIKGRNCYGAEKADRIKKAYRLPDYDERYAYGDSKGDRPMMALATNSFYRPFR